MLHVRIWTEEEFASSREAWNRLLADSDADPLFMSWDWQWRWWTHHAKALGATLRLVATYTAGGELIGLAPFYSRSALVRGFFTVCRMELIGIAWREARAAFSDYLDLIAARAWRDAVVAEVARWLQAQDFWQELVLAGIGPDSLASRLARIELAEWTYLREVDPLSSWRVRLPLTFEEYLDRLNSEARRRVFNQRRKLVKPAIERAAEGEVGEYLEQLWQHVDARWGAAAGTGVRGFHLDFAACMARAGQLRLTRLVADGSPVSLLYNVRAAGTEYYLQSGFDAARSRGMSLGYLHFGFAIEEACTDHLGCFDFLAGSGRHREYKQDLLTERSAALTYHVVRGPVRRALYAAYELTKALRS